MVQGGMDERIITKFAISVMEVGRLLIGGKMTCLTTKAQQPIQGP